tara:strand:+ start:2961 stop:3155 length:195 start_codon:yes stop_codon:yes gene_type:complete
MNWDVIILLAQAAKTKEQEQSTRIASLVDAHNSNAQELDRCSKIIEELKGELEDKENELTDLRD